MSIEDDISDDSSPDNLSKNFKVYIFITKLVNIAVLQCC